MDADPELTQHEMLQIRASVQRRLMRAYHEHLLLARAYRKTGKLAAAAQEQREANAYLDMLRSVTVTNDPTTDPDITRLLEDDTP